MGRYIKSHSNFRISARHQLVNGGAIYERDITTLGGISPLGAGQSKIYSSGNFIITINNETASSRHIVKKSWIANDSGTVWNADVLSRQTSDINGSVEDSISLHNDFMNLRSFACYGSLYMLIQNSIADIIDRFPYELYTGDGGHTYSKKSIRFGLDGSSFSYSGSVAPYTSPKESKMYVFEFSDSGITSGFIDEEGNTLYEIENPGGIDIHSNYIDINQKDPLKYFANNGYLNYGLFDDRLGCINEDGLDFTWQSIIYDPNACPKEGDKIAKITLITSTGYEMEIFAYWGENLEVKYYTKSDNLFFHIRPRTSMGFYDDFIDSLDMFQKCLMGVYSKEKGVAKFEVLTEYGSNIVKTTETFKYPFGKGDYNVASDGFELSNYLQKLAKIGLQYDDKYSNSLYRVATHESLKNFDWTRNFNGLNNDYDNDYIVSGDKFKAFIHIMGYVFDKEKVYIDCIGNRNTITYDSRANLSDYFLTDELSLDGWEVNNIFTYDLIQYDKQDGSEIAEVDWSETNQRENFFTRNFMENNTELIEPWSIFNDPMQVIACGTSGNTVLETIPNTNNDYYYDATTKQVKNVIKSYLNTTEYTIPDINNEFMKRLKINSKNLLRKKGTIEGIESLLSLFGLRSKRWFNAMEKEYSDDYAYVKFGKNLETKYPFDYSINEYSSFAPPISEEWDAQHDNYKIDYINSCKTINYTSTEDEYVPYQGLPVAYRDIEGMWITSSGETTDSTDPNIYLDSTGNKVKARRLYPFFDSNSIYDGNTYYQMNGGWNNIWPFSYDANSDIINNYSSKVYKETLRDVRQVKNIEELISQPLGELVNGITFYVNNLTAKYAIIDGRLYPLYSTMDSDGMEDYYFTVEVYNHEIVLGNHTYNGIFTYTTTDYNRDTVNLNDFNDGAKINIYYCPELATPFYIHSYTSIKYFILMIDRLSGKPIEREIDPSTYKLPYRTRYVNEQKPDSVYMMVNESYHEEKDEYSHYFLLRDVDYSDLIENGGWEQLSISSPEYLRVNAIVDEYKGNNPHSGGFKYDSGFEYINRFAHLFDYALDNGLFNMECLNGGFSMYEEGDGYSLYDELYAIGFDNLVGPVEEEKMFTPYQNIDKKIHAYVDRMRTNGVAREYSLDDRTALLNEMQCYAISAITEDGVSAQVMNTKVIDLCFYLKSEKYYSKACQEEIKHIQDKILPYVEQMIPSTAILKVKFFVYPFNWVYDDSGDNDAGEWKHYFYWTEAGLWAMGDTGLKYETIEKDAPIQKDYFVKEEGIVIGPPQPEIPDEPSTPQPPPDTPPVPMES